MGHVISSRHGPSSSRLHPVGVGACRGRISGRSSGDGPVRQRGSITGTGESGSLQATASESSTSRVSVRRPPTARASPRRRRRPPRSEPRAESPPSLVRPDPRFPHPSWEKRAIRRACARRSCPLSRLWPRRTRAPSVLLPDAHPSRLVVAGITLSIAPRLFRDSSPNSPL